MSCGVKAASNTLNIGELGRYQSGQLGRATDNARIDALVVAETHSYQREWYPTRVRGPGTHKATADTDNIPGGPKTKGNANPPKQGEQHDQPGTATRHHPHPT